MMIVYGSANSPYAPEREHHAGDRDEGVRGVQVAAEQEPGDDGAEAASSQAPLLEMVEVRSAPSGRAEAEHA